jgi:hypothetical protein
MDGASPTLYRVSSRQVMRPQQMIKTESFGRSLTVGP